MSRPRRRGRGGLIALVLVLVVAGGAVAGIALSKMQASGQGSSPTASPTIKPATPTASGTPAPSPSATPSPTAIPATLAEQAVQTYWNDVANGEYRAAYLLLSVESQLHESENDFAQKLRALLATASGITPEVGTATVAGLRATVPVTILEADSTSPIKVTQHLVWEKGAFRIDTLSG